jgi:predicted GNAT family acetyltransferase
MRISVDLLEDAATFSAVAGEFLRSRPVHHNLMLTLLDGRLTRPEPGRYWVATRDGEVAGVVFQSPLTHSALLVPMEPEVLAALADAMAETGAALPGVSGEAATAASFAGRWTENTKSAAVPRQGLRIYELDGLKEIGSVEGNLRKAEESDRALAERWAREFQTETHEPSSDPAPRVDAWLAAGQIWLWQNGEAVSMTVTRKSAQGVVRLGGVYTPPEKRGRGYATACVHGISKAITTAGFRCILYTDLGNPTSNSIYRKIGYHAVSECLHYRFELPAQSVHHAQTI